MAFVSPDLAQSIVIGTTGTADDGTPTTEGNLNDNNTGTTAGAEIRAGMTCYKITHDLGFPVANLDNSNMRIRIFDGVIMTAGGLCTLYPYIDGNSVHASVSQVVTIVDNGAYDDFALDSAFVDALADVGTDQIAIRMFATGSGRGRFNEIQIEFFEEAGGAILATPDLAFDIPTADLEGTGKLDATPDPQLVFAAATADLEGTGELDATPDVAFASASADLSSTSALDATPDLVFASTTADLNALGELGATASMVFAAATALLRGTGLLGATATMAFASASADLIQAPADISATPDLVISATADLNGLGDLNATPDLVFAIVTADLNAEGKLDATATLAFDSDSADLNALGKLDASPDLVFSATADISSTNEIDASPDLTFAVPDADLKSLGSGAMDATPTLIFASDMADLEALGKLDATPDFIFTATADLLGSGKLDGLAPATFSATANLGGTGQLSATVPMTFSIPSADLLDGATQEKFYHIDLSATSRGVSITGKVGQFN